MNRFPALIKLAAFLTFVLLWAHLPVFASEHWRVYNPASVPFIQPQAVVSYKGNVFVSGVLPANQSSGPTLWRTSDGDTWTTVALPAAATIVTFCEYQGQLYGFASTLGVNYQGPKNRYAFRTADGLTWTRIDGGVFDADILGSSVAWTDSIAYDNHVYVGDSSGAQWRTLGLGASPAWEKKTVNDQPNTSASGHEWLFASHKQRFFMAYSSNPVTNGDALYHIDATSDWNGFESSFDAWALANSVLFRASFAEFGSYIYWGAQSLVRATADFDSTTWVQTPVGTAPSPFVFNNHLRAYTLDNKIYLKDDNTETWSLVGNPGAIYTPASKPVYGKAADMGNLVFVLPSDLMMMRQGAFLAVPTSFSQDPLKANDRNKLVLQHGMQINIADSLSGLQITNLGTAMSGRDIQAVHLYAKNPNAASATWLGDFTASGGSAWTLSLSQPFLAQDGVVFQITVDIAAAAQDGTTCRFEIEPDGFLWMTNGSFRMPSALSAPQFQVITGAAGTPPSATAALEGVVASPVPSRDRITFLYSLSDAADVKISVYSAAGQLVSVIDDPNKIADMRAKTVWDGSAAPTGVYFAIIEIHERNGAVQKLKKKVAIER